MKRISIFLGSLWLAGSAAMAAPSDASKAASSEADKWAASIKTEKSTSPVAEYEAEQQEAPKKTPTETKTPPPPAAAKPAAPAAAVPAPEPPAAAPAKTVPPVAPKRTGLNEMRGKLLSKNNDPKTFRLIVAGGFNVEFTYDQKTQITSHGERLSLDDLGYNDEVIVRYAGKDLMALEVERVSKASRPE